MDSYAPRARNWGPNQVAAVAEDVAKKLEYRPGDDLREVVKKLGGKISYVDFWGGYAPGGASGASGSIEVFGEDSNLAFEIRLALDTGELRDRFTIAHELGHYVLHFLYPNAMENANLTRLVAERNGSGQAEKEANWFAASFLMPSAEYKKMFSKFEGNHLALSEYFKVSVQASSIRAQVLQLNNDH